MNLAEIFKLSAAGYKVSEINELKDIVKDNPDALNIALNGNKLSDVKDLIALADTEEGNKPDVPDPEPGKSDPEPDYKKMYEELKQESDTMKATIKDIQEKNNSNNNQGNIKSNEETMADIARSFM